MAVDMFIKIGDVEGESADKTHAKQIDVLAWSSGMSQSGSMHVLRSGAKNGISDIRRCACQALSVTTSSGRASRASVRPRSVE